MSVQSDLEEKLSEHVHHLWMGWARIIMNEEKLSSERVARWTECFVSYDELSEEMKELDRKFARQFLEIINTHNTHNKNTK